MRNKLSQNRRAGMVLMIVMACLAIAMSLVVGWARIAVMEHRQIRAMENRLQAEWLADSALQRAAAQLIADRNYPGESWQVSAADLGASGDDSVTGGRVTGENAGVDHSTVKEPMIGAATITVEPLPDRPEARQVRVSADYPTAQRPGGSTSALTNRVSKQMIFDFSTSSSKQPAEKPDTAPDAVPENASGTNNASAPQ